MTKQSSKIRTRFAPSPTGAPHVGNIRTALFVWLFARHNKGNFILRVEDTDQSRAEQGSIKSILEALNWLGLDIDEGIFKQGQEKGKHGPYTQSNRLKTYRDHAKKLVQAGHAFYCFCSQERLAVISELQKQEKKPPKYDGQCLNLKPEDVKKWLAEKRSAVIRMKVPQEGETSFKDTIKGNITVQNSTINYQVLLKSDGFPTYHLASVVDDYLMEISHVLRADEWIASTPKHVLLYQYFGWEPPEFIHLPIILGQDKSKLSKRHGAISILDYKKQGYLADAVVNFLALLGWNPKTNQEILSRDELIEQFDVSKINKNSPVFELQKLDWMNKQYIKEMSADKIRKALHDIDGLSDEALVFFNKQYRFDKALNLIKDRLEKLSDFEDSVRFLWDMPDYKADILVGKGLDKKQTKQNLEKALELIDRSDDLRQIFLDHCDKSNIKRGDMLWPLRVAITGMEHSPEVFASIEIIGKDESRERVEKAIEKVSFKMAQRPGLEKIQEKVLW
jgi:glutamyl-tRNA synthetase|tara:strand:- start:2512 stop:4029 length:1518 start_codon:yes stop_codon:yes gene_type:complete